MLPNVFLTDVNCGGINSALHRLIEKLKLPDSDSVSKIGIKINLCDYRTAETGAVTDPAVLDPLLGILRELYPVANIFLFESDATGTLADNLFRWLNLDVVAKKHEVGFVNLSKEESWERVKINGVHFKEIEVPTILLDSLIINHPKLKTHGRTKITCGLKNMYGCYRVKEKVKYHKFLNEAIVDINIPIKSHYVIVDGNLCLEGNRGPTQGLPKKVGVFVGGDDIVAVDAFCAKLIGFNPKAIKHILMANKHGLGSLKCKYFSEFEDRKIRSSKFRFNMAKYYLMEILRKVM